MLLTIYNLPAKTRYADIKSLIHSKCGFKEVILDNLTQDNNNNKKVTVGLAEEEDAAILVRKINGLFLEGHQLYVETIKKKANTQDDFYKMTPFELRQQSMHSKKPASSILDLGGNQQPMLQQPYYQQSKYQPNYQLGYSAIQQNGASSMALQSMGFGGVYGNNQNATANYGYPQQMQYQSTPQQLMAQSMVGFDQRAPLGFSNQGKNPSIWSDQNDWNLAGNASGGNQNSQQSRSSSKWDNNGDSSSRSRRDGSARDSGRDRPSREYGQEAPSRNVGRNVSRRDFGRDAPSRDRGRDAPRDHGRDAPRGHGRDAPRDHGRDRGRDAPARDRGRDAPARNVPARNATSRDHGRDAPFRRPEPIRAPTKRQFSPPPTLYGDHVTNTPLHLKKKFQQRDGPKPNQPWSKPQPKKGTAETNYVPASKRPQKGAGIVKQVDKQKASVPANSNQAQTPNPKRKKLPDTPERMLIRSATWRHQIASMLAKEIINNPEHKNDIPPKQFIQELKQAIRCRLEGIFGDDLEIRMGDMLKMYREKFSADTDTAFFNEVREDIKNKGSYLADGAEKAIPIDNNPPPVVSGVNTNVENEQEEEESDGPAQTIPSYPQGDKKMSKVQKKTNALIFQDEKMLLSNMEPSIQKALNEEIDEMSALIATEFEDNSEPELKNFDDRVRTTVVDDLKKMIKVNLAKRMLNAKPIMLRIFNVPKTVSRSKLAPALAKYGVSSLRKSDNRKPSVYYGTCETYDVHDKLCSMEPIVVDGSTVIIKPFHLTGKYDKMDKQKRVNRNKKKSKDTAEDPLIEDLEELDEEIDEDIINLNTDYEHNQIQEDNENPEIIKVDTKKEVQKIKNNVDDENGNENINLEPDEPQESIEYDNAQITEVVAVKTESNTQASISKSVEDSDEGSEVKKITEVDNTKKINAKPKERNVNETPPVENLDFTADVDINEENENKENSFKIDAEADHDMDKVLSELNPDDLEDFRGRNVIDDIDMADLNDDDLEDW